MTTEESKMSNKDDYPVAVTFTFDGIEEKTVIVAESTFQASVFVQDQGWFQKNCIIITPEMFQGFQVSSHSAFWIMMIVRAYCQKQIGIRPVKRIAKLIYDVAISAGLGTGTAKAREIHPKA